MLRSATGLDFICFRQGYGLSDFSFCFVFFGQVRLRNSADKLRKMKRLRIGTIEANKKQTELLNQQHLSQ